MIHFEAVNWKPSPREPSVLEDVTLTVPAGEFCCVVGPSGAGKTTLLRLTTGLVEPTAGQVFVNGETPAVARPAVSMVFQQPVLFPWRTVQENIELPLEIRGGRGGQRIKEHLELVRLAGIEEKFPRELSGGMRSRVAIARALVTDPSILLMDEPFADLDEINREHLNEELQRIWITKKLTVMFVTHDLAEAVFLADRIIVLSARPARLFADIRVPLPRPRSDTTVDSPEFEAVLREVRHALRAATKGMPGGGGLV